MGRQVGASGLRQTQRLRGRAGTGMRPFPSSSIVEGEAYYSHPLTMQAENPVPGDGGWCGGVDAYAPGSTQPPWEFPKNSPTAIFFLGGPPTPPRRRRASGR